MARNLNPPVTLQPQYNLLVARDRVGDHPGVPGGRPWAAPVVAARRRLAHWQVPEATSVPTGATRLGEDPERGVEAYGPRSAQERTWDVLAAVEAIAKARGCSSAQVALSWVRDRPTVSSVILGCRTIEQLDDNLGAADLDLDAEETEAWTRPATQGRPNTRMAPWPCSNAAARSKAGGKATLGRSSMFEFAGGEPAFLALAAAHHQRCLDDPVLNHPFSHPGHPRTRPEAGQLLGGGIRWAAALLAIVWRAIVMLALHAGTGAESDLGDRFVECFVRAADDVALPDDADFRRGLRSYMEWAVSQVMSISPVGATVPANLSVPRWSWDGLQPERASGSEVTGTHPRVVPGRRLR